MFARLAIAAAAAQLLPIVVPLGKTPPRVEQPAPAPIETAGPAFAAACKDWDDWAKPAPPVHIYGNTFLVGTCGISAILITDPQGATFTASKFVPENRDLGSEADSTVKAA